jgi:hypothetical protein
VDLEGEHLSLSTRSDGAHSSRRRAVLLTEIRTKLEEALASLDGSTPSASTLVASTSRIPMDSSATTSNDTEDEEQHEDDYSAELGNPLSLLASISLRQQDGEAPQDEFQAWLASAQRYYGTGSALPRPHRAAQARTLTRSLFFAELYRPRYDTDPMSDPVVLGLLSEADLARLVDL